jgi:hypothetical protein
MVQAGNHDRDQRRDQKVKAETSLAMVSSPKVIAPRIELKISPIILRLFIHSHEIRKSFKNFFWANAWKRC